MTSRRARFLLAVCLLAIALSIVPNSRLGSSSAHAQTGQVRALWVDAFHDGIKNSAQIEKLVADARRANVNTLLVQVRKNGDLYYLGGPEPPAADQPPGFDALATLLKAARSGSPRLEIHAWIPTYRVWGNKTASPDHPNHVYNRHGPNVEGYDNWLLRRDDGETWTEGYHLDPGHPAAQSYVVELATDLVRRYDVEGLHLDRIRYPDPRWGYNETSVARFAAETGRSDVPAATDPAWMQFRRDRVTELLVRVRESALAARPGLKVSAALIPWGNGPGSDAEWTSTAAYSSVFQDWRSWLERGLLDQAYVMNYYQDADPERAAWLDRWLAFQRRHSYGRQVVAGLASYNNAPSDSIRQIRRALTPDADGRSLAGVALYSYAVPDPSRANADPADDTPDGLLWDVLVRPAPENDDAPPFAEPAPVPAKGSRN